MFPPVTCTHTLTYQVEGQRNEGNGKGPCKDQSRTGREAGEREEHGQRLKENVGEREECEEEQRKGQGEQRERAREGGLSFCEELRGVILRRGKALAREDETRTKNCFCRGKVGDVMRRGTKGKKEPRKVC